MIQSENYDWEKEELAKQIEKLRAELAAAREALEKLLNHLDKIAYRDAAGLRLGDTVPVYEQARALLGGNDDG